MPDATPQAIPDSRNRPHDVTGSVPEVTSKFDDVVDDVVADGSAGVDSQSDVLDLVDLAEVHDAGALDGDGDLWSDISDGDFGPDISDGDFGPDGSDGDAGTDGSQECGPNCGGKECGPDGCGGSCGTCDGSAAECVEGICNCVPDCACLACGPDGCGGTCGDGCSDNLECTAGVCVCQPDCSDKDCGGDGCGGYCGTCLMSQYCLESKCLPRCGNGECDTLFNETSCLCPQDCGPCAGCCRQAECHDTVGPDACGLDGTDCTRCLAGQACLEGVCEGACGDGQCQEGENCATCAPDCGHCCGDGVCDETMYEDCFTCQADCDNCCGDGVCVPEHLEWCETCPADCTCSGDCGDGICAGEYCLTCMIDCGSCCGSGSCYNNWSVVAPWEDAITCPTDCGLWDMVVMQPMECGNGVIDYFELCDDGNEEEGDGCSPDCFDETKDFPDEGSLVITEMMIVPEESSLALGQWFEIQNVTAQPIPLQGVTAGNDTGASFEISQAVLLDPGERAVLAAGDEDNVGFEPDVIWTDFQLVPLAGQLTLWSPQGEILDSVQYQSPGFPIELGRSANLHQMANSSEMNDLTESWCASSWTTFSGVIGSPGSPNMLCPGAVTCGDGLLQVTEECDDGNQLAGDGCDDSCRLEYFPICGNGIIEACEECDDGNTSGGDGCNSECLFESAGQCGNGHLEFGEQCDDGNLESGDGCGPDCRRTFVCGNGVLEPLEQCDDGNTWDGDGCNGGCDVETAADRCGDGIVGLSEQCDDGCANGALGVCEPAFDNGDGCSVDCRWEGPPVAWPHRCGNGIIEPDDGEECDPPYHSIGWDMCLPDCTLAPCHGACCPSACCGNGKKEMLTDQWQREQEPPARYFGGPVEGFVEECDDGNLTDGDGCSSGCWFEDANVGVIAGSVVLQPETAPADIAIIGGYDPPLVSACGAVAELGDWYESLKGYWTDGPVTQDVVVPDLPELEETAHYAYPTAACQSGPCVVYISFVDSRTRCLLSTCAVTHWPRQFVGGPDFEVQVKPPAPTLISGHLYLDSPLAEDDKLYLFVAVWGEEFYDASYVFEIPNAGSQVVPYEVDVVATEKLFLTALLDRHGDLHFGAGPTPDSGDLYGQHGAALYYYPKCDCPTVHTDVDISVNTPVSPTEI